MANIAEFYEYWEMIPDFDKYERIGQEIVKYKRNMVENDTSSNDLSVEVIRFLDENLLVSPYPILNIIHHITMPSSTKNKALDELCFHTIEKIIEKIIQAPDQRCGYVIKLYNLLSNIFLSEHYMNQLITNIYPRLYDLKENRKLLDDVLYLALLSHNVPKLIVQYLKYERSQIIDKFQLKSLFLKTCQEKCHWIDSMLNYSNDAAIKASLNHELYQHLAFYRLILKFGASELRYTEQWWLLEVESIDQDVIQNGALQLCLSEIVRQKKIIQFINSHPHNGTVDDKFMSRNVILNQLLTMGMDLNLQNYDDVKNILVINHDLNLMQWKIFDDEIKDTRRTEVNLLSEYIIVKHILSIMQSIDTSSEDVKAKRNHIRTLLKSINDGKVLFQLINIVLSLVFLRYEHIRKTARKKKNSEILNQCESFKENNSHSTDISDAANIDVIQKGFICSREGLKIIIDVLRLHLMTLDQLEVYQSCDDDLKSKFVLMINNVDNALWRIQVTNTDELSKPRHCESVTELVQFYTHRKKLNLSERTSDEENILPNKKVHRKRLKKRKRINFPTEDNDEASDDDAINFQQELPTESSLTEISDTRRKLSESKLQKKPKSVIAKMLASPQSLITMCVLKNDFENVDKIINIYHLEESDAANEIQFIRNFQDAKEKLKVIVKRYLSIHERSLMMSTMSGSLEVNEIKIIAEAGFEIAKFLNILETFTAQNKLKIASADKSLMDKSKVYHQSLALYSEDYINVLPLIDLMISLPCPFEINQTFFRFIIKNWRFAIEFDYAEEIKFGYLEFLRNTMDILTILKNHDVDMTIRELFTEEVFSLKPTNLNKQLENRQNAINMISMNLSCLNNEPELLDALQKFDDFDADNNFLARVVCYVKNVRLLMKFQTNETFGMDTIMMQMNLDNIIGKIIFIQQYSPQHVENFAYNVNVNLIHSMAIAAAGEFPAPNDRPSDENLLSLFYVSEIGASAIDPELINDSDQQEKFKIINPEVLNYIKNSNFMLVFLLKEIQNFDYKMLNYDDENFLDRMKQMKPLQKLINLYDNATVMILSYDRIDLRFLLRNIRETKDLFEKLEYLNCITERQWNSNRLQLNKIKDYYIEMLVLNQSNYADKKFTILEEISSVKKFSDLLLACIGSIESSDHADRLLRWCLNSKNCKELNMDQCLQLQQWMYKLKIYKAITELYKNDETSGNQQISWTGVMRMAENSPQVLVNYLINVKKNCELCLKLLEINPFKENNNECTKMLIECLNNKKLIGQHHLLFKIIEAYPGNMELLDFSLGFLRNIPALSYVTGILVAKNSMLQTNAIRYQKYLISTRIFECLESLEKYGHLWSLASRPLLIIEQFLMNSKIELLSKMIAKIRPEIRDQEPCSECQKTSRIMYQIGEMLVYDFDVHHKDMFITNECIDLLLKLYASKALDFQIVEVSSVPPSVRSNADVTSIDSLNSVHQLPKEIPPRENWIPDNATTCCMSCKRMKFSLISRRHHCRRCGNVVCGPCSPHKTLLPTYGDVSVRVCTDCVHLMEFERQKTESGLVAAKARTADDSQWKLTGDLHMDQTTRDEFSYEYIPNAGLCVAIQELHTQNDELSKFFLFHCHRLELLLRPIRGKINPEVDVILVSKMLKILAFAAKIRGSESEANIIIDHADIILKLAQNGCETIAVQIPMEPVNNVVMRTIINDLIKSENWNMALELSVKWGRTGAVGVFSAWGISLLKAGRYQMAREKISLVMQPIPGCSPKLAKEFIQELDGMTSVGSPSKYNFKRYNRSPTYIAEILEALETMKSISSLPLSAKPLKRSVTKVDLKTTESALNVLQVMDNLRKIADGDYGGAVWKASDKDEWRHGVLANNSFLEESIYYLITYGGNIDILNFLINNNLVRSALIFLRLQKISEEIFIQCVYAPILKNGRVPELIELLKEMSGSLVEWRNYILGICKHLERKRSFNCLYQLQILIDDNIRAGLTCIKFYLEGSKNFQELMSKNLHLEDAKRHLQTELEIADETKSTAIISDGISLKWDLKTINGYINSISLQQESSKYLADCESLGLPTLALMPKIFPEKVFTPPTLFGKIEEKSQVAILIIVCGHSIESGFGLSYRLIQEFALEANKIYSQCVKYLATRLNRLRDIGKLITCIKDNTEIKDFNIENFCDEQISIAIEIAHNHHEARAKSDIDSLIKRISDPSIKVRCFIASNQLLSAYLLAVQEKNLMDVKRVMKIAEATRQENVRRLCARVLMPRTDSRDGSTSDINSGDNNKLLL